MKILFGNHHLEIRAGSELFTAELARSLRALGNDVAIFTFFKGEFAAQIEAEGIPVFDPDDADAISRFMPDIIQTCHLPCAHFLRATIPEAVRVHAMLGVIPALEAPPLDGGAFSLGLAVSEEVIDRISRTPFGRDVDLAIFRNWFDDSAVVAAHAPAVRRTLRVAVISNHIAPELIDALAPLEAAGDIKVGYFGMQHKSAIIDGALLVQYDLIVSIGRTVLLAAACGVPCIMADIHGSDGLLTIDNIDMARTTNFSGRLTKRAITSAHLREEIEKSSSCDHERLRNKVAAEYSLSSRIEWLLSRYDALLADRKADEHPRKLPDFSAPSEGLVYAEMTSEVRWLRAALTKTQREIEAKEMTIAEFQHAQFDACNNSSAIKSVGAETKYLWRLLCKSMRP